MKPVFRYILATGVVLSCTAVWFISSRMAHRERAARTCQGKGKLQVMVTDSLERRFVAKADVQDWLEKEYGAYAGLPLDSVDLNRIEKIISAHSAVRECEAWITDDGVLHVQLSQRQPVLRLDNGHNACYADATGYLFPLQSRGSVEVPVVSGALPVRLERGYKGFLQDESQALWLSRITRMVLYMKGKIWEQDIDRIRINDKGEVILYPVEGKEEFLFGPPVRIEEKFRLLTAYYRSVVPSKEPGYYKTVDLRYRKQVVCKK